MSLLIELACAGHGSEGFIPALNFHRFPTTLSVCLSVCLCLCLAASVPKMNCPPPQIPAKRHKVPRIVVLPQLDTARLFWKGIRCIAADRVYKLQKNSQAKTKDWPGMVGMHATQHAQQRHQHHMRPSMK